MSLAWTQAAWADTYFQYPIVPDSIQSFTGRCDYQAQHFFDFCDLKKAFSNRQKMGDEFRVYLSVIANATPTVAQDNLSDLMKKLEKQPADQLFLAEIAEGLLYGDTAQYWIDNLYLPIAEAVATNKKINKAERARYEHQAKTLANSMTGGPTPDLAFTRPDGTTANLRDEKARVVIVFFNDPDCSDCSLAKVRLNADISTTELIDKGIVKIVSISLTEPDEAWKSWAATLPEKWVAGAAPDADLEVDLRSGTPDFYMLDSKGTLKYKHLDIDQVLDISRQLLKR